MNKLRTLLFLVATFAFAASASANWQVVQSTQSPQTQGTTVSVQFPTSVTPGNLIIVHVISALTSQATVTDSLGNTYTLGAMSVGTGSNFTISAQVFYVPNALGGPDTVTVSIPSGTFLNFFLYEVSGAVTAAPVDVTATGNGLGATVYTGTATTTSANDFVFVGTAHHYGYPTPGSGFVALLNTPTGISEYETPPFAGAIVSGGSTIAGINPTLPWAAALVAFKAVSTGGTGGATLTSIQVAPASGTISFGQSAQFSATGVYSDGSTQNLTNSVTWSSSNTTVATISSSGQAIGGGHGITTITATLNSVSGSTPLTVEGALSSLQVTPSAVTILAGSGQQFTATGSFNDGSSENLTGMVSWISSNTSVATINSSGLLTAISAGTVTVTAMSGSITGSTTLTVQAPAGGGGTTGNSTSPVVQSNLTWSSTYFMGTPPTTGGTACTPAPCIAQAFLNPNQVGDMIFVWISWNVGGFSLTGLTDTAGNTYTHLSGFPVSGTISDDFWVAYNVVASPNNQVIATFGSGTLEPTYLQIVEYSGLATSNALDVYSTTRQQNQCIAPCTQKSAPTPTTTNANDLLIAVFDVGRGAITAGSGWYPDASCFGCLGWETDVSGNVLFEHKLVNTTGSYTATITNNINAWPAYDAYLFAFKLHP
jgi:hypothetical protein